MAQVSQGTTVWVNNGSTFIKIAEVKTINGPGGGQGSEIDVTHLESVAREFENGLPDEGELTLGVNWIHDDPAHDFLFDARQARTKHDFEIRGPSSSFTLAFNASVPNYPLTFGVDAPIDAQLGLRISGAVTKS